MSSDVDVESWGASMATNVLTQMMRRVRAYVLQMAMVIGQWVNALMQRSVTHLYALEQLCNLQAMELQLRPSSSPQSSPRVLTQELSPALATECIGAAILDAPPTTGHFGRGRVSEETSGRLVASLDRIVPYRLLLIL